MYFTFSLHTVPAGYMGDSCYVVIEKSNNYWSRITARGAEGHESCVPFQSHRRSKNFVNKIIVGDLFDFWTDTTAIDLAHWDPKS